MLLARRLPRRSRREEKKENGDEIIATNEANNERRNSGNRVACSPEGMAGNCSRSRRARGGIRSTAKCRSDIPWTA